MVAEDFEELEKFVEEPAVNFEELAMGSGEKAMTDVRERL